jgi:hypothetical protein
MQYLALTDLYMPNGSFIQAGTSFTGPPGWPPPTNAVTPQDPDAIEAYWLQGPRGCNDAECWRALFTNGNRWVGVPVPGPSVQWVKVSGGFVLSGGGGNLGVHPVV